jgi:hypothetical protein
MPPKNAQGTPPEEEQGDDAPKYVTEEQLNKAISARFGDFSKKIEKTLGDVTTSLTSAVTSKFEELSSRITPAPAADDSKAGKPPSLEDSPVVKGLQKTIAELKLANEKVAADAQREREQARDVKLRTRVQDELVKSGVDSARARHALALLVDSEKRIKWEGDGDDLVFRDQDNTEVDLKTGIAAWTKGDDGKHYLPASGASGSGARAGGNGRTAPTKGPPTRADIGNAILGMALSQS